MSGSFLSSDEYAEKAHQLYNTGFFDDAIELVLDGLAIYPTSVELHVALGYLRLAREEYAWARGTFESALSLDPTDEDALVGLGETILKFGELKKAIRLFEKVVSHGFEDDHDLMLQIARALFRENQFLDANVYFRRVVNAHPNSAEARAGLGYTAHRLGGEADALQTLRSALELDEDHFEARVYLGNVLYDRGEYEAALYHYERTHPENHFDELAVWRLIELKKSIYHLNDSDADLAMWIERLSELAEEVDSVDQILAEIESTRPDGTVTDPRQLDLFGALLTELFSMRGQASAESHKVKTPAGKTYTGTWPEIVLLMSRDDPERNGESLSEYMARFSRLNEDQSGIVLPATDAASFIQACAAEGLLVILR
jgi:tetratricopeptide (TPR) repeat protein